MCPNNADRYILLTLHCDLIFICLEDVHFSFEDESEEDGDEQTDRKALASTCEENIESTLDTFITLAVIAIAATINSATFVSIFATTGVVGAAEVAARAASVAATFFAIVAAVLVRVRAGGATCLARVAAVQARAARVGT